MVESKLSYSKFKELSPDETINKILEIFKSKLNVVFDIKINKRFENIYSVNVIDKLGNWNTSGKGTDELYSVASGLGEAIEHICNYQAYDYNNIANANKQKFGFERYVDEVYLPIEYVKDDCIDIFKDMLSTFDKSSDNINSLDVIKFWEYYLDSNQTNFIKFFDLKNNVEKYLPEKIIWHLCGSNGGGAGNSNEEAIGHAVDEIIERYVKHEIYSLKLTPPTISKDFLRITVPELLNVIESIETQHNIDIIVKDASLGKDYHALCILLINRNNHSYLVNFGSHPKFEIALERCITEVFQSYKLNEYDQRKNMKIWNPTFSNCSSYTDNWVSLLRDDVGDIPNEFFTKEYSWEFKPWNQFLNYSNKDGLQYHLNLVLNNGFNVYIRNNSYLRFPVFFVYIPKMSLNHVPINEYQYDLYNIYIEIKKKLINKEKLNEIDIQNAKRFFNKDTYFYQLFFRRMNKTQFLLFQAAISYDENNLSDTLDILNREVNTDFKTISNFIHLTKMYTLKQSLEIMESLYNTSHLECIKFWDQGKTFKNLFENSLSLEKFDKSANYTDYINQLYLKFKEVQISSNVNQSLNIFY